MRLILLNNHTALAVDDRLPAVTLVNGDRGTLVIEGEQYPVESGKTPTPVMPERIGHVRAYFVNSIGVRWTVIRPRMVAGVPYSAVDLAAGYMELIELVDRQARELERITQEILDLRAMLQPDALGFLNIGGEENEETD